MPRYFLQALAQASDDSGKPDLAQFAGGNLGVCNYPVTAESRLRKKMAVASDYSQSKSAVMKQNPQAVKDMLANDPDATVYLVFRPSMQQSLGKLKQIDQAKQVISSSSEPDERKQAAVAALDQARQQELVNTGKVDRAVDLVLRGFTSGTREGCQTFFLRIRCFARCANRANRRLRTRPGSAVATAAS